MFGRHKKAAQLACAIAMEMGKPRYLVEMAGIARIPVEDINTAQIVSTIKERSDLSARVDDLIDAIQLLPMRDREVDLLVRELAGYFDGSLIPRVARFAHSLELRRTLIEAMFIKPPESLEDIYDALSRKGLATDHAKQFGEQLMRLAIERDDPRMLSRAALELAHRDVTMDEWKTLIRKRIGVQATVEDVLSVARSAVSV